METTSLTQQRLNDLGWILTLKGTKHVNQLCQANGFDPATWYRWVKETGTRLQPYDNMVCSPKTDERFLMWVEGEKTSAKNMIGIQLNLIKSKLEDALIPLDEVISRPIKGATPLVQFVFGKYLDYPQAVENMKEEAKDELLCKPWMADAFGSLRKYLPE